MTSKLEAARNRLRNLRERSDEAVANGVTSLVTVAAAGGMAYANVKWPSEGESRMKFAGIDVDLAGGLLFNALGFAGLGASSSGKSQMTSMLLHAVGNGLLSSYAVDKAQEMAVNSTGAAGYAPRQMGTSGRPAYQSSFSRAREESRV